MKDRIVSGSIVTAAVVLFAASQVTAIHFQTIAEVNDYWRD